MIFTSFNFLIFFAIVIIGYYSLPIRFRKLFILLINGLFYCNLYPIFGFLLGATIVTTFIITNQIDKEKEEIKKKFYFRLNIFLILLPLLFFKYFSEINDSIIALLNVYNISWYLPKLSILLPIGISFYTFSTISYIIDVYHEEIPSEKSFVSLAAFLSFFPLILSGPIERAKNILPQLNDLKGFNYELASQGFRFILWGYFMKLVVANRLDLYVGLIDSNYLSHSGASLLFASVLYPFQIYADLGGYSLIAIGVANILGIKVCPNFNRPFFAENMSSLWRRWHITLISFLTDYVYSPLSFTFRSLKKWGVILALLITFVLSGLWHGATLNFILWGLVQGVFLSIESLSAKNKSNFEKKYNLILNKWYLGLNILITFILFAGSQIIGRTNSVGQSLNYFDKFFNSFGTLYIGTPSILIFGLIGVFILLTNDFIQEYFPNSLKLFNNERRIIRYLSYSAIVLTILLIGVFDGGEFIYFQF